MNAIIFMIFVLQAVALQSTATPVQRLQAKLPVEVVTGTSPSEMAGRYTSASEELAKKMGGGFLSGDDLYLFPDGTYIYCEWADIEPLTARDKGTWATGDGLVVLTSDAEVTWAPGIERKFAAVHRVTRSAEVLLVGLGRGLEYFEKEAADDPEIMLLIVAKQRARTFNKSDAVKMKKYLMKKAWHPDYFRKG